MSIAPGPKHEPIPGLRGMVKTIIKGLEDRKEPPPPTEEVAYELTNAQETPATLEDTLKELSKSFLATELPSELVNAYVKIKQNEWEDYLTNVGPWEKTWNIITQWEYNRYLVTA